MSASLEAVHHAFSPRPLVVLDVLWGKEKYRIQIELDETVDDLRSMLELESGVRPENQKLFGLKWNGKSVATIPGNLRISELDTPKEGQVIKMMGSSDDIIEEMESSARAAESEAANLIDDLDWDYVKQHDAQLRVAEAKQALNTMIPTVDINFMCSPRPGKGLLVLDLDHTLLDFTTRHTQNKEEMKRPFLDEFLKTCFEHYDLCIWSQTKLHWIEIKLIELGLIMNPNFSLCFALDRSSMFKVTRELKGEVRVHEVKALDIIWAKLPQYSAKNTIHIDDLSRNFAMNPRSGLQCTPFKRKRRGAKNDRELLDLAMYLISIATTVDDFTTLDHSKWRKYLEKKVLKNS